MDSSKSKPLSEAKKVLASLQATCSTRAFRTVPPQELTDAAHKAARLIDTDAHIQTASRAYSYTRPLWWLEPLLGVGPGPGRTLNGERIGVRR